jgi:hypothetical protein
MCTNLEIRCSKLDEGQRVQKHISWLGFYWTAQIFHKKLQRILLQLEFHFFLNESCLLLFVYVDPHAINNLGF